MAFTDTLRSLVTQSKNKTSQPTPQNSSGSSSPIQFSAVKRKDQSTEELGEKGLSIVPLDDTYNLGTGVRFRNNSYTLAVPNTKFDFQGAVGDVMMNSAVAACMNWITRTFPEAPLQIKERDASGVYTEVLDHELIELIENPNPYYDETILWSGTLVSYHVDGNAYWYKRRSKSKRVVELYYIPHFYIEPRWDDEKPNEWLSHYEFYNGRGAPVKIPKEDIVHFRCGMNVNNDRKGQSQLASVLREIFTDNEANNFSAALLKNMGIPGIVISPSSDEAIIPKDKAEAMKDNFKARFTSDNRGEPLIVSGGIKIQSISLNPQQLDLKLLHRLPEERISAVLGIPAIVVGLGAGLERSTMANFKEAREMAYESNIIPTQTVLAKQLKKQLLPDFEKPTSKKKYWLGFDLSNVRVLQGDTNIEFQRMDIAVRGGWMRRSEARRKAGLPVTPQDEIYLAGGNNGLDAMNRPIPGIEIPDMPGINGINPADLAKPVEQLPAPDGTTDSTDAGGTGGEQPRQGGRFAPSPDSGKKPKKFFGFYDYLQYKGAELNFSEEDSKSLIQVKDVEVSIARAYVKKARAEKEDPLTIREILLEVCDDIEDITLVLYSEIEESEEPKNHLSSLKKWAVSSWGMIKLAHIIAALYSEETGELGDELPKNFDQIVSLAFKRFEVSTFEITLGITPLNYRFLKNVPNHVNLAINTYIEKLPLAGLKETSNES